MNNGSTFCFCEKGKMDSDENSSNSLSRKRLKCYFNHCFGVACKKFYYLDQIKYSKHLDNKRKKWYKPFVLWITWKVQKRLRKEKVIALTRNLQRTNFKFTRQNYQYCLLQNSDHRTPEHSVYRHYVILCIHWFLPSRSYLFRPMYGTMHIPY